jgi:murein DD-endopeptidase MepM/ murein hydrolase activator NlpD
VVSGFGNRVHPVYGTVRFHSGIDINCANGAPVGAAAGGVVIQAGWNGGYGNSVVIDHGNGFATLYGHMSAVYVGVGSSVGQGANIGAVGSTGLSTGPHMHFEVRINGTAVDPMGYL